MKYLKSKKILFDHAAWSRWNLLVYSSQRQIDPKGAGLALWSLVSFPATIAVLNDLECSVSLLLPLKISSVLVAWQPPQCDLPLTPHVHGMWQRGTLVWVEGLQVMWLCKQVGNMKAELGKIFKDSCLCPCLCAIAPSARHLSLSNTLSQSEQYFEGKEARSQCELQSNKNVQKIKF